MAIVTPDVEAEARALVESRRLAAEAAEIQAEIDRAQQAAQQSRAQRDQQMRAAMLAAIEKLRALAPRYAERQQAAARALSVLADFVKIEHALLADEARVLGGVDATGLDGARVMQNIIEMRQAAGLPLTHDRLSLAAGQDEARRVALTMLAGFLIGLIGEGTIAVGGNVATLNIS